MKGDCNMLQIGDIVKSKGTERLYTITKLPEDNKTHYHANRDGQDYYFYPDEIEKVGNSIEENQVECKYCNGKEDVITTNDDFSIGIENNELEIYYQDPDNFHNLQSTKIKMNYCPLCGKKLL
jgi:DNA-directed RNA polymerase subunit RPC12/RpoP